MREQAREVWNRGREGSEAGGGEAGEEGDEARKLSRARSGGGVRASRGDSKVEEVKGWCGGLREDGEGERALVCVCVCAREGLRGRVRGPERGGRGRVRTPERRVDKVVEGERAGASRARDWRGERPVKKAVEGEGEGLKGGRPVCLDPLPVVHPLTCKGQR